MKKAQKKGFTLVEIMIVVVIIGLLAAMAIPAFQRVRQNARESAITNNLRQLAAGAEQYFLETGATTVNTADLVGTDNFVRQIEPVAGEDYTFDIAEGFTELSVTTTGGTTITYP